MLGISDVPTSKEAASGRRSYKNKSAVYNPKPCATQSKAYPYPQSSIRKRHLQLATLHIPPFAMASFTSPKHLPPLDGSLEVFPGIVDFHAEFNPSLPWAKFVSATKPGVSESISFLEYAQATHRIAHAIRPGRTGPEREVVAVLVHCDSILYLALLAGMIRAGFVPFPMSPRNSPEAVVEMLKKTSCARIVYNPMLSALTLAVQSLMTERGTPVDLIQLPEYHTIFPSSDDGSQDTEAYPTNTSPSGLDDVVLYLHSSGSTGFPKPIPQTNKIVLQWMNSPVLFDSRGLNLRWASAVLPTFHTMGIMMQLYAPLASAEFVGLYAPQAPAPPVVPSPQNVLETARMTGCNAIPIVPSLIEIWAQNPETVKYLASLDVLAFAGGPLSDANGDKLVAAGVKLFAVYGATECGVYTRIFDIDNSQGPDADVKTSADWAWMQFSDRVTPHWIPQGDGTFELQFLTTETHQPAIENLSGARGYATSDLWEPHPKKKGLWRIVGRTDDVIVLGSGEKIVPIPQESYLGSLPSISGAIIFGRGQTQAGVLIELRPDAAFDPKNEKALTEFRNNIWPHIEEANKLGPSFARIFKEMILVADPARPMQRAAKGTAMRKMVLATYAKDIEELYKTVEASTSANGVSPPASWTVEDVEEWLVEHATTINKGQEPSATVDIFEQGFDSLNATFLRNRIIGALRSSQDAAARDAAIKVPQEFIFTHSTLQQLAVAVVHLIDPTKVPEQPKSPQDQILDYVQKYSSDLPDFRGLKAREDGAGVVVLLTGSTGSLGSHILAALLADDKVSKVFTVDRGSESTVGERLRKSFEDRGLPVDLLKSEKLVATIGDLSKADLGLQEDTLNDVRTSVTHIIHNAWKLDFNLSLTSFESHIANTRSLINFSSSFTSPPKFLFSSSIAAAQSWDITRAKSVPEKVLVDSPEVAVGGGYGGSKYVVERVLKNAKESGLDTISVRIGQLSGSTTSGAWNVTDWVPIIVKSSVALGALPDLPGAVDWTPVDVAARTIADIVTSPSTSSSSSLPELINLVHPRPVPWSDIFSAVHANTGSRLPTIPFAEWLSKVEAHSANATEQDFAAIPAIKLLRFFRGIAQGSVEAPDASLAGGRPTFDSLQARKISAALDGAKPIGEGDVKLWLKYWDGQNVSGRFFGA
ncbi:hypothetical protein BXZ70DRAFT_929500 [Cristinia sonorae]|uniref:Uncharacterized protein n=1 Tax=Cristinia sonorae TaxID=1940300 RepID=A0A8K0UUB2_9AGAR|nr:hypothetical protein BXZ70DRAFT_929500 [Cristinia sonorae]